MLKSTAREEEKYNFLTTALGNKPFVSFSLPVDASFRKYERIITGNHSFILMDCPLEHYDVNQFVKVANLLLQSNLSVPKIYNIDEKSGFLLLEDFGCTTIKQYLLTEEGNQKQEYIYKLIIELLTKVQAINVPSGFMSLDHNLLFDGLGLFLDWYLPLNNEKQISDDQKEEFNSIWKDVLQLLPPTNSSLVLRDFHIENKMLLRDRSGILSIGLLDFQDALVGSPIYDVVSVLKDARFDIEAEFSKKYLDYYLSLSQNLDKDETYLSYHILGAQRNSRILGIFARKFLRDKQNIYLSYIPRVRHYLSQDVSHPLMKPLKNWLDKNLNDL